MLRRICIVLILLLAMLSVGCSSLQCWHGECKDIQDVNIRAVVLAGSQTATDAELATGLQEVADHYAALLDNARPLFGLYASAKYNSIITRMVANSAEVSRRASNGSLPRADMVTALSQYAAHLSQLRSAMAGER